MKTDEFDKKFDDGDDITGHLEIEAARRPGRDDHLDRLDNPELLARTTADAIPSASRSWEAHLGPFYDVEGVRRLLSSGSDNLITRQAVSKRNGLLALTTRSGKVVYPAFQFDDTLLTQGTAAVVELLPETLVSPWSVASWLMSPEPGLNGCRPVDVMKEGGLDRVLDAANDWARALTSGP